MYTKNLGATTKKLFVATKDVSKEKNKGTKRNKTYRGKT